MVSNTSVAQPLFAGRSEILSPIREAMMPAAQKDHRTDLQPPFALLQTFCFFMEAQDSSGFPGRLGRCHAVELRHPWLGRLKAVAWTAVSIGLSLGIAWL